MPTNACEQRVAATEEHVGILAYRIGKGIAATGEPVEDGRDVALELARPAGDVGGLDGLGIERRIPARTVERCVELGSASAERTR
jgi:hypothetical protein